MNVAFYLESLIRLEFHKIKRQICGLFQMYPFPIPDLFCGNPLVVSGKFKGSFPDSITVFGLMPDQSTWQIEVPSRKSSKVPLSKVRHRLLFPSPSSCDSNCNKRSAWNLNIN